MTERDVMLNSDAPVQDVTNKYAVLSSDASGQDTADRDVRAITDGPMENTGRQGCGVERHPTCGEV